MTVRVAFIITGLLGLILAATGLLSTTHADSVTGLIVTAAAALGYGATAVVDMELLRAADPYPPPGRDGGGDAVRVGRGGAAGVRVVTRLVCAVAAYVVGAITGGLVVGAIVVAAVDNPLPDCSVPMLVVAR